MNLSVCLLPVVPIRENINEGGGAKSFFNEDSKKVFLKI